MPAEEGAPNCTCSNPAQWLELACPEHGPQARAILEQQGVELPPAEEPEAEAETSTELETTDGEEKPKRSWLYIIKELNPEREKAAVMLAWGASKQEICAELGIARQTLMSWRKSPVWIERYQEECKVIVETLRDRLVADRSAAMDATQEAREKLLEMLDATDADGNALYGVQLDAAKVLMTDQARTGEYAAKGKVEVEAKIAVGAVIHVHDDSPPVEVGAVIDVPVVAEEEVADDGDR